MQNRETAAPVSIDCGTFSAKAPWQPTQEELIEPKYTLQGRKIDQSERHIAERIDERFDDLIGAGRSAIDGWNELLLRLMRTERAAFSW